jgi:hypothetical protein
MSSCRATSFYLAPGVMRYFRDHTLAAVLPDGTWIEITHRADIARLRHEHPEWDGTVLCSRVKLETVQQLRELLLDDPAKIERWNIDPRVIEGRRPEGPQFVLHRMVWNGVEAVGGTRQIIDAVLPGCNKTLRRAAEALILEHGETAALRLSVTCAMRGVVSDDELAAMLTEPSVYELQPWLGVEIDRFRENFLRATEHAPHRRAALIRNLLSGETLTDSEIVTAIDKADRISPALAEKLLNIDRPSLRDLVVDIACLPGLSPEQHIAILNGDEPNAKRNLGRNNELTAETVEEAHRRGAYLTYLWDSVPLTDALVEVALKEREAPEKLYRNERLSPEQQRRIMEHALTAAENTKWRELGELARNPTLSEELRLELIQRTLESEDGRHIRQACCLLKDGGGSRVQQALLATNDVTACRTLLRVPDQLDDETLRKACDVWDSTNQVLAVRALLQRGVIEKDEELKILEACDMTVWPQLARAARHPETIERLMEKVDAAGDDTEVVKLALSLLHRGEVLIRENDLTRGGIVEALAGNTSGGVTTTLLNRLAMDDNPIVAMSALHATGARVDESVRIQAASTHPEAAVRGAAYKTRAEQEELQLTALRELPVENMERRWMVTEAYLSSETQRVILEQNNLQELIALGSNKGTLADETTMALLQHQSPNVRRSVAARRDLSDEGLEIVLHDSDAQTYEAGMNRHYGGVYNQRGERIKTAENWTDTQNTKHQSTSDRESAPSDQEARIENRDTRDIHVITTRRDDTTLIRSHHPIEYTVEPAAVLRESIEQGAENRERIFPDDVRDVRRLPDWGSLPFRSVEPAVQAIDGYKCSVVAHALLDARRRTGSTPSDSNEPESVALVARVLDSRRAIEHNAEYMGNCTAGYTSAVGRGEVQLVALDDANGQCMLNVELKWDTREIRWVPGEINTRFNGYGYGYESTPESVKLIADQLAERLNNTGATP